LETGVSITYSSSVFITTVFSDCHLNIVLLLSLGNKLWLWTLVQRIPSLIPSQTLVNIFRCTDWSFWDGCYGILSASSV